MTPSLMQEVMTSFGKSGSRIQIANDFASSEHGIGLKLACLRLGKTAVVVTRHHNKVSIGMLSQKFINDCGSGFLVAPMICYDVRESDCLVAMTPESSAVFATIVNYCGQLFSSE